MFGRACNLWDIAMVKGIEIRVRGQVQGVGFRPFIWRLAQNLAIRGKVLNDAQGVLIHAAGVNLDAFVERLKTEAPPLSSIEHIKVLPLNFIAPAGFEIAASRLGPTNSRITPDTATCAECIQEIQGSGRRKDYAFTNCTACGPRFTIITSPPYDRSRTTMAAFSMCSACNAEYQNPADRHFHAQPIACPECGPSLHIEPEAPNPLAAAAQRLRDGQIVALKGLGGFHIACDATSSAAIALLRARKRRPAKPLALMGTCEMIARYANPSGDEIERLCAADAPILLLKRGQGCLPAGLAPGLATLGWMLPHTPLHHLLLDLVGKPLVMTSGNISGAPQVVTNEEAQEKLGPIADSILFHNRDIARRLDDSIERMTLHGPIILRYARGRAPTAVPLPKGFENTPDTVSYGAHMKSAICLSKNGQVILSHHLGDLENQLTWSEFLKTDKDYANLFDHAPVAVACDLHPDYRSSRYAAQHAAQRGLSLIKVQHHHAHLASCLAENLWPRDGGAVAGIVLDGLGLGPDGTIWGGELLVGDYENFRRAAWLKPAPLPGGDAANKEPWRNLLARLDQCGLSQEADNVLAGKPYAVLRQSVSAGFNAPLSSSAGRLFDAFAAALGYSPDCQSYEGEAAMRLESNAAHASLSEIEPWPIHKGEIDPAPIFLRWAHRQDTRRRLASLFHVALAASFAAEARRLIEDGEARAVALSGGCMQNALLRDLLIEALAGLPVLVHRKVPANDGGLALGQTLIALAALESK